MRSRSAILTLLCVSLAAASARAEYGYPIGDPYLATVLGTPPDHRAPVPAQQEVEERSLVLFEEREIPDVFWHQGRFRYSLARQPVRAPLIFLVAGTGARYDSAKLRYLQAVFHQAGFHVVNLTSPTHLDFVVTGSRASVPGVMREDVRDLYSAMQRIWEAIREQVEVSEFHLSGYSLGGSQSAFLAELDSRERVFGFSRVLMLNPSVDLFTSVTILDDLVREAIPGGSPELRRTFSDLFSRVARYLQEHGRDPLDSELLFQIAQAAQLTRRELQTLIGVSFRMSSASMLFSSDVMTGSQHLVDSQVELGVTTPLLPYLKVAARWTWVDYLDEVLLPFWRERHGDLTRKALIEGGNLHAIEAFLRRAKHVGVMHNRDDLILGPGDIAWLERTFGDRATFYPRGGHCGNLMYRDNVEDMLAFFGAPPGAGE